MLWQDLAWSPLLLPRLAKARGAHLLHCPAYKGPLRADLSVVLTVHDVYPLQNPRAFGPWWAWYFRNVVSRAARRADRIITSSAYSAAEISASWDIDPSRIRVLRYGVGAAYEQPPTHDDVARVRRKFGLPPAFFLFVGSLEPRKNLSGLLQAIEELRSGGRDCRLVVVGPPGWRNRDIVARVARAEAAGWVSRLGFVDDADLAAIYAAARALVMPSFHEGFGFPVIEAMSCGCPVIAARAGSLPEITGDAGLLVEPRDATSIAAAIARIDDDDVLRNARVAKGRSHALLFRWDACAAATLAVYHDVLRSD
jgi:glycosyltransferase involved in cell wall biosynthesis